MCLGLCTFFKYTCSPSPPNTFINIKSFPATFIFIILFFIFLFGIHSLQGWTATTRHGVTRKKNHKKITAYKKSVYKEPAVKRCLLILDLKPLKIIGQRKTFYRQRIPGCSCASKKTVDIEILVTSRNGDRKVIQSIRITSRPPSRKRKWNQFSQF